MPAGDAEALRARFVELAAEGFEEAERGDEVELAAYGLAAERVAATFPDAVVSAVEAGWEDRWREFHRGIRIGRLWVGPPWETPPRGALAVVVDPGRAFGTGAHPTTRLSLELLLEQEHESLLDVGCGSGVIAIAAARLGHAPVFAVDVAETSVEATRANAAANAVDVSTMVADAADGELPEARLAIANISPAAVAVIAPRLAVRRLIASGHLASDALRLAGYRRLDRRERDGWAAELFERR